jgi:hypothetical protein
MGITLLESNSPSNTNGQISKTWHLAQVEALAELFNLALAALRLSPKLQNKTLLTNLTDFQGVPRFHKGGSGSSNSLDSEGFQLFAELLESICQGYVVEASQGRTTPQITAMATSLLKGALYTAMAPGTKVSLPLGDFWNNDSTGTAENQLYSLSPNLIQVADNVVMAELIPNSNSGAHFAYDVGYNISTKNADLSLVSANESGRFLVQQNLRRNIDLTNAEPTLPAQSRKNIADLLDPLADEDRLEAQQKLVGALVLVSDKNCMLAQIVAWNISSGNALLAFTGMQENIGLAPKYQPRLLYLVPPSWMGDQVVFIVPEINESNWTLHKGEIVSSRGLECSEDTGEDKEQQLCYGVRAEDKQEYQVTSDCMCCLMGKPGSRDVPDGGKTSLASISPWLKTNDGNDSHADKADEDGEYAGEGIATGCSGEEFDGVGTFQSTESNSDNDSDDSDHLPPSRGKIRKKAKAGNDAQTKGTNANRVAWKTKGKTRSRLGCDLNDDEAEEDTKAEEQEAAQTEAVGQEAVKETETAEAQDAAKENEAAEAQENAEAEEKKKGLVRNDSRGVRDHSTLVSDSPLKKNAIIMFTCLQCWLNTDGHATFSAAICPGTRDNAICQGKYTTSSFAGAKGFRNHNRMCYR